MCLRVCVRVALDDGSYGTQVGTADEEGLLLILRVIQELLRKADSNSIRRALYEAQCELEKLGAVHMIYAQLCQSRPAYRDEVFGEVVKTAVSMLSGGNLHVQRTFYALMQTQSEAFLHNIVHQITAGTAEVKAAPAGPSSPDQDQPDDDASFSLDSVPEVSPAPLPAPTASNASGVAHAMPPPLMARVDSRVPSDDEEGECVDGADLLCLCGGRWWVGTCRTHSFRRVVVWLPFSLSRPSLLFAHHHPHTVPAVRVSVNRSRSNKRIRRGVSSSSMRRTQSIRARRASVEHTCVPTAELITATTIDAEASASAAVQQADTEDVDRLEELFRFLQVLCEGHFAPIQNFLRDRSHGTSSQSPGSAVECVYPRPCLCVCVSVHVWWSASRQCMCQDMTS